MIALTVVPVAITISDVLKCRKDSRVVAGNGQRYTHSSLRPQEIPQGLHIVQYAPGDHHKEWAVGAPILRTVSEADGRTHYVFGMRAVL